MQEKELIIKKKFILAVQNHKKNNFYEAEKNYIEIIKINPNHIESLFLLASLSAQINKLKNALILYKKVILLKPRHHRAVNNLCVLLAESKLVSVTQIDRNFIKNLLLFLFSRNDIEHKDLFLISRFLLFKEKKIDQDKIVKIFNTGNKIIKNNLIKNFLKDKLFLLMLQKSLMTDIFLEELLTKIRYEILVSLKNNKSDVLKEYNEFIISLSEQCFLNEYIYNQKKEEVSYINNLKKSVEKSKKINEFDIAILGSYIPLYSSSVIVNKLLKYKSKSVLFNNLVEMQIREPFKEEKLKKTIQSFGKISDSISKKVKKQYEENPYPRWRYTYSHLPVKFVNVVNHLIKPNEIKNTKNLDKLDILVAGCGTGKQIVLSNVYRNASILGIDLSLKSISYAKRKIEELGLKNVQFLQSDILQISKLKRKFDFIECSGVLHHMKSPLQGIKILVGLLKPNGLMRIGLYSKVARQDITRARNYIKENHIKSTIKNIKNYRQVIINQRNDKQLQKILYRRDFYSTSSARDLMFHTQEHQFTLPQISNILKNNNLEFLGFADVDAKKKYSKLFPSDIKNISLENWNKFEAANPDTFVGMYSFFAKKKLDN